ncbi:GTPase Era [Candidatus Profftia tarda]|uniref:GTPase Era n=1 Tax=Candidatus Profftia tarda TaxID=1177216 RepID=A0A8E4EXU2_9ENTR|nr:GTPase Era [Candidatus Profftia tarda]CAD6506944.1 GTPase Era [Candidatus Profftia tarda]
MKKKSFCGLIPIVGHANVGKSTLLNQLLGHKISITSRKPQTTRQNIMGIRTEGLYQAIYVDTPGLHTDKNYPIDSLIHLYSGIDIQNVSLIIFTLAGTNWTKEDKIILNKLRDVKMPVILAINKIDNIKNKEVLLPHIQLLSKQMNFIEVVPISAKIGTNVDIISNIVSQKIPESMHFFSEEHITDHSNIFIASEIIREKLMRFLGEELPYSFKVKIELFSYNARGIHDIHALILVERAGQKKIIIGNQGSKIKKIGSEARKDMEIMLKTKVYLKLWVKVRYRETDNL